MRQECGSIGGSANFLLHALSKYNTPLAAGAHLALLIGISNHKQAITRLNSKMKLKFELKSEGEAALHGPFGLREIERAAVAGNERAISLGKQIANVNQRLHPIRKELSVMDGLP